MDVSLVYLNKIKQTFPNQPQVYLNFEKLVRAFLSREIDGPTVAAGVRELFDGHSDLLLGFSKYLPAICSPGQLLGALQELDHQRYRTALCFINAVEKTYLGQPDIFSEFLKINIDTELHPVAKLTKVRVLFRDHPELIQAFQGFMPPGFAIEADLYQLDPAPSNRQNEHGLNGI